MTNLPAGHLTDADAQRLVDGVLSADEAREAERHVLGCAACGATVETYRLLASALDDLDVPPLPDDFTDGVLARIEVADRALARERRHALAIFVGAVAAAAVAFGVAGAAAWAPAFSSAAEVLGGVVHAFQVGGAFVPKIVSALRLQIIVAAAVLVVPLLLALVRLMPAPSQTETA
jgi:anti-sigma factor RsiW